MLSTFVLAAGSAQFFDFNNDGIKDAVLVNTGTSPLEFDYTGGSVLDAVPITANGGGPGDRPVG